jgi:adenine-specific DNA-methyltransferase
MMQSRLRIAKRLLNPKESVLICTIDEKEFLHLGCLLEEMFPEGRIQMISSVINPAGAGRSKDFSRTDEYIFCVQLGTSSVIPESRDLENVPVIWDTLRRSSLANARGMHGKGACGPNQFFPIYVNEETGKIVKIGTPIPEGVDRKTAPQMKGCCAVFPVRPDGTEMNWGIKPEEAEQRLEKGYLRAGKHQNEPQQYVISYITGGNIEDIESGKAIIEKRNDDGSVVAYYPSGRDKMPTTNWNKPLHDAQRYGTNVIKAFIGNRFPYPKSLYAVRDILKCFLLNKPNATVVDFFAGSGTTLHALFLLNAEDGGTRHGILVTNNEISEAEEKKMTKLGYKKGDAKWEALGIANYVTWPRIVAAITGVNVNGQPAVGQYVDLGLPYSSGFSANVKYFKCNWIERRPANYLLSNALCLHIKEMIELQNAIEVDNKAYILILSHQDYLDYVQNSESKESIKQIWVNQNIIFSISEIRDLKQYRFRYVPKEYFGQELKEVAE